MKKILMMVLDIIVIISISACGSNNSTNSNTSTAQPSDVTSIGGNNEAVDLGLSVKWAVHNMGATKPEEYGDLYGWSDATGKKISTSNSDYPNDNPPSDICSTKYDIAHMQWGGSWRLPTREEQEELVNDCTWTKTSINKIEGYRVTGPNGNSIFLPASGGRIGKKIHYRVSGGDYWSGTLSSNTDEAYYSGSTEDTKQ